MQAGPTSFHTEPANSSEKHAAVQQATPAMQQYLASKAAHPDCLLFYRMGDFYELFFDDARKAANILGIALTKRGRHEGDDIAMCGVPVHSADGYLETLIASGCKVAICEQMEDVAEAKKRGPKAVMRREVVRIVTPGTITEETLLDARASCHLAAVARSGDEYALAWLELSTGAFFCSSPKFGLVPAELARLEPREILIGEGLAQDWAAHEFWQDWKGKASIQPQLHFDHKQADAKLKAHYGLAALDVMGEWGRADRAACGALIGYLALTQKATPVRLDLPRRQESSAVMAIDPATRRNLELVQTLSGERQGSLLSVIDRTVTGAGARMLAAWLGAPLTVPARIHTRQEQVAYFFEHSSVRAEMRAALAQCPDWERSLSRLCLARGGPRDLLSVQAGLETAARLRSLIGRDGMAPLPEPLAVLLTDLGSHEALAGLLRSALKAEAGLLARDGNFVREGYHPPLDEFRGLRDESKRMIAALEARYQQETGIAGLKIRYNNVLGYYAEITPLHQKKITQIFIHRQTMANALRYTTAELGELERKIAEAGDRALKLEIEIFESLVNTVTEGTEALLLAARATSALDVTAGLAELAAAERYVCPKVDDSDAFAIRGGRHPVVEAGLKRLGGQGFIGNDSDLSEAQRLWLLTGPNMAGKSTFLRQNALIALLAQAGAFVPAESAHIGIVDRLFSRVGAADDLARGRSTFMVEMVETATILHQATARSLVILDEIGRGTATFDGLSLAWAVVEHLHDVTRCRTLFATHYHEMTAMAAKLKHLSCRTMKVKEWKGDVVFLHEVVAGAADRSYGIHVARLAGLPAAVITRATEVLHTLEQTQGARVATRLADDLPLFRLPEPGESLPSARDKMIAEVEPDRLSPREALEWVYALKEKGAS